MTDPILAFRRVLTDFGSVYFVNGLVAFIFAASGPVAIILAVGTRGARAGGSRPRTCPRGYSARFS